MSDLALLWSDLTALGQMAWTLVNDGITPIRVAEFMAAVVAIDALRGGGRVAKWLFFKSALGVRAAYRWAFQSRSQIESMILAAIGEDKARLSNSGDCLLGADSWVVYLGLKGAAVGESPKICHGCGEGTDKTKYLTAGEQKRIIRHARQSANKLEAEQQRRGRAIMIQEVQDLSSVPDCQAKVWMAARAASG